MLSNALFFAIVALSTASVIPDDWRSRVDQGQMLFSDTPAKSGFAPYIGNGFFAYELDKPFLFMAGVFNGYRNVTPSHRAAIPTPLDIALDYSDSGLLSFVGNALDLERAIFYARYQILNGEHCPHALIEQRWYAHQSRPNVGVHEIELLEGDRSLCSVYIKKVFNHTATSDDFTGVTIKTADGYQVWTGETQLAETNFSRTVTVAVVSTLIPKTALNFATSDSLITFLSVFRSTLEGEIPEADAIAEYQETLKLPNHELIASHIAAWAENWKSGIELEGNVTVAAAVNSSLYYIFSSIREDWHYGLSPGGLSAQSYNGHSFWDTETWMYPNLLLLRPNLAQSLLTYRSDRLSQALQRASERGWLGANWPWESAYTGVDCTPGRNIEGNAEQHITGDIVIAFRQYYRCTNDKTWLKSMWQNIYQSCVFFACRLQRVNPDHQPTSSADACGVKTGTGNFTILNVQPPDEAAGLVNSSCYTNAVASSALQFCIDGGREIGEEVPTEWQVYADNIYLPIVTDLYPAGPVHSEYDGYHGQQINQADVTLIQYPLLRSVPRDIALNDLAYYTSKTDPNGMFTGDSAYSIAYLGLGNRTAADNLFFTAFYHIDLSHFNVWSERPFGGGVLNFITGAGGFLQNFMFGYSGMRITDSGLQFGPTSLLPPSIVKMKLRNLTYLGTTFSLITDESKACVDTLSVSTPLMLVDSHGSKQQMRPQSPVCVDLPQSYVITENR